MRGTHPGHPIRFRHREDGLVLYAMQYTYRVNGVHYQGRLADHRGGAMSADAGRNRLRQPGGQHARWTSVPDRLQRRGDVAGFPPVRSGNPSGGPGSINLNHPTESA